MCLPKSTRYALNKSEDIARIYHSCSRSYAATNLLLCTFLHFPSPNIFFMLKIEVNEQIILIATLEIKDNGKKALNCNIICSFTSPFSLK